MPSQLNWIKFVSQKKKDSADQREIIPFDEYIFFFACCELSHENKNEKTKPDRKSKWNHQKTVLGES